MWGGLGVLLSSPQLHLPPPVTAQRRHWRTTWSSFLPPSAMSLTSSSPGRAWGGVGVGSRAELRGGFMVLGMEAAESQDPTALSSC